jgi:hypothetical protein
MTKVNDILHLLAWNGYEDEAYKASQMCRETWDDERILCPHLLNKRFGPRRTTLIGINCYYGKDPVYALKRVQRLVSLGANPDLENGWNGYTPFMELCMQGDAHKMDLFSYLLSRPIRINGKDGTWCPLSLLAKAQGSEKKMELLLARGADINRRTFDGKSVLFLTCHTDVPAERIDFLCQQGANVHLSSNGETPLALCFQLNKVSFARELIRHGAIIPDTAMEDALEMKLIDVVSFLVEQGVPFPTDALQLAINQGKAEKVRILLVHNAPLYIAGKSALFYAVQGGIGYIHTLIVQYLCAAGANVNEVAEVRHMFYARTSEEPVLYDLIRQYIYTKNQYIHTNNQYILEIIKILIEFGAVPPPHTEYSYIHPFYSNPSMYSEMNAILLRARIA